MAKRTTQENILDGIESNIQATEMQISQLEGQLASFAVSAEASELWLIIQQLDILQRNLDLLKLRRIYALGTA